MFESHGSEGPPSPRFRLPSGAQVANLTLETQVIWGMSGELTAWCPKLAICAA